MPTIEKKHLKRKPAMPEGWRKWVAENRLLNVDNQKMVSIMVEQGLDALIANEEVNAVAAHPYFKVAESFLLKLRKLESLMLLRHQLSSLSINSQSIERRSSLSKQQFLREYYSMNRPVVIADLMGGWSARSKWTSEFLKQKFGEEIVEIMGGRNADARYEPNADKHKRPIKFADYVDLVEGSAPTNDYYLVANNHLLERERMKALFDDIQIFPEYLDPSHRKGQVFFWYGPAGTVTPMHHDTMNILMAQVRGSKRIKLVAPEQTPLVYNNIGVFSEVDCDNPDYAKHPLFKDAKVHEVDLAPGEVLFLPVGWWHHVRALDVSISVTFTNFQFPNSFTWVHPNRAN